MQPHARAVSVSARTPAVIAHAHLGRVLLRMRADAQAVASRSASSTPSPVELRSVSKVGSADAQAPPALSLSCARPEAAADVPSAPVAEADATKGASVAMQERGGPREAAEVQAREMGGLKETIGRREGRLASAADPALAGAILSAGLTSNTAVPTAHHDDGDGVRRALPGPYGAREKACGVAERDAARMRAPLCADCTASSDGHDTAQCEAGGAAAAAHPSGQQQPAAPLPTDSNGDDDAPDRACLRRGLEGAAATSSLGRFGGQEAGRQHVPSLGPTGLGRAGLDGLCATLCENADGCVWLRHRSAAPLRRTTCNGMRRYSRRAALRAVRSCAVGATLRSDWLCCRLKAKLLDVVDRIAVLLINGIKPHIGTHAPTYRARLCHRRMHAHRPASPSLARASRLGWAARAVGARVPQGCG